MGGLVVAMAIMIIAWAYLTRADAAKAPTGNQAASLEIVERGNRRHIVVVGAVSNLSDVALRDIYFFARFLDSNGNTIDASYARLHTMVVPAWSETPFRLPDHSPLRGPEEYASCSVEIRFASAIP